MSISARKHKHRASAGMARRLSMAIRNGLRYGPACHPFRVRLRWVLSQQTPWHPEPPRLFQNDGKVVDYTRAVPRGREYRG